jgi:hypothetical protein
LIKKKFEDVRTRKTILSQKQNLLNEFLEKKGNFSFYPEIYGEIETKQNIESDAHVNEIQINYEGRPKFKNLKVQS